MTAIRSTCPRDCYDGCGIVVTLDGDKRPRVSGDPEHPTSRGRLCAKCGVAYNGVFQDEAVRLTSPLRRRGPKGSGKFDEISWDTALNEIAGKLNGIIASRGADAILTQNYSGTLSLIAYNFPSRFVNHLGAAVVEYGTICNVAGYVAWDLLFGTHDRGFDPRTARDSSCILVWGANPAHTAPHMHEHWLEETPGQVVVVDPVRTTSAETSDLHLQPRPGSDAALAFGMLHALRERDAFDDAFIAERTLGFAEIEEHIGRCSPEWAEQQTGVAASDIRRAAALYASGPALLWAGQGLQRQPLGGNIMRAVGLLPTVTGNVGKAGAGFYYLNDTAGLAGIDEGYLAGETLAAGKAKTVGALDLAQRLLDPDEFAAYMVWNSNPLASCSDQQRLRRACAREDLFMVAIDLFETDTARFADVVLPAASFLESDDIAVSYMNLTVGAQSKVREPIGESLPNQEIFRRLAGAMHLEEPALFESDESMLSAMLGQAGVGYDFAELKRRGYFFVGGDEPQIFFADLKFPTPSGKIEIGSDRAEKLGLPRAPHPGVDPQPDSGQLRLLTPASKWRMNDSYANEPRLERRAGPAELIIHPADAERLGIAEGATVEVGNEAGTLSLTATISDIVRPGTVVSYKGRWPLAEPGGKNVNFLHKGEKSDMGDSSSVHGTQVTVGVGPR